MIELTVEEFEKINDQELTCIFAETGMDRERDFDRDKAIDILWFYSDQYIKVYPQLQFTKDSQ